MIKLYFNYYKKLDEWMYTTTNESGNQNGKMLNIKRNLVREWSKLVKKWKCSIIYENSICKLENKE